MLLGTSAHHNTSPDTESLIIQLLLQQRYAEAYELLIQQQPASTSALYNMALCLHWSGNYQEALSRLDKIQLAHHVTGGNKLNTTSDYKQIKDKQIQTNDYLQGISESYVKSFPALVHDAIVRLKTDCWLQLGNYAKVVAIATPIAHKNYKNITEALNLAATAHDQRI
ncbi:tetratricopeptide repeat protein [Mucilaginibacter lacusdianchii]|uniref:tetratricopeptide repeat protein n=1 Tax=Mucilaginibacter lacusdianchii TaxID=2684211 RepID=UPI00131E9092|nr:tetratricopeptide repeat protein [Mucilaginibacter sp. JXJ CY 39]